MPLPTRFDFGAPVLCSQLPDSIGIVAETRRKDCRVLFPLRAHSAWLPFTALRPASHDRIAGTVEGCIVELLALLSAVDLELGALEPGRYRLIASHGPIEPGTIDRVRDRLGESLTRYVIRPGGMRRMQTILEFRTGSETVGRNAGRGGRITGGPR